MSTSFTYNSASTSGELAQVTFPYLGYIGWQYGTESLEDNHSLRAVTGRSLYWSSTPGVRSYTLTRDSGGATEFVPQSRTLVDATANATKVWTFDQTANASQGLVASYSEQQTTPSLTPRLTNYTWAQDSAGNSFISQIQTISDPGKTYAVTKQVGQTLDQYGNVTQTLLYNFSNLTTPAKTYTNTYASYGAMYGGVPGLNSTFVLNRLLTSTVANGTTTVTLASNTWAGCVSTTPMPGLTLQDGNGPLWPLCQATTPGQVRNYQYDLGGNLIYTDDGTSTHSVSATMSSATNYAAPSAITTASSLTTSLNWNAFLAPTQSTGPNGDVNATAYNSTTGRPTTTTGPYGAVTTYTYSNTAPQVIATTNGSCVELSSASAYRSSRLRTLR